MVQIGGGYNCDGETVETEGWSGGPQGGMIIQMLVVVDGGGERKRAKEQRGEKIFYFVFIKMLM